MCVKQGVLCSDQFLCVCEKVQNRTMCHQLQFLNQALVFAWYSFWHLNWVVLCMRIRSISISETLSALPNPVQGQFFPVRLRIQNWFDLLFVLHAIWCIGNICGASKIKLKKVNKKRTVTVRRVIIFLNISRHPLLICLQCCLHQYRTLKAVATATAAIVLLTPAKSLKKDFLGFLMVSPLFNHFRG